MSHLCRITALAIRRTCVAARHHDECDESFRSRARSLRTPHNSAGKATLQLTERYFNRANQQFEGLVVPLKGSVFGGNWTSRARFGGWPSRHRRYDNWLPGRGARVDTALRTHLEHDLADVCAGLHQAVFFGTIGQPKNPVDDRLELLRLEQRPSLVAQAPCNLRLAC